MKISGEKSTREENPDRHGQSASSQVHFDESGLLERHSSAKVKELTPIFVSRASQYLSLLAASLAEGNVSELVHYAHTLKGAAYTLGADRLAGFAGELEELGNNNELEAAGEILEAVTEAFASLREVLVERGWLNQ